MLPVARILCPTDFSQPAMKALDVAGELALHFGAELIVLHVVHRVPLAVNPDDVFDFDVMSYEDQLHGSFERSLRQAVSEMKAKPVATRLIAVRGEAAEEIVRCVKKEKVDLLVISTQGRTGLGRLVFGSVAEKVLRLAACPVLVIKVHSEETGEAREPKPSTPSPEEEDKSHRKMIEQQVRELKTKFDELKSAFDESKAEGKKKYRKQIEELRGKGEEAQKKLETLKGSGGEAGEEMKGGRSDLKDACDRAM